MDDNTAETLASLIKSVGKEKAEKIVLAAYRLGYIDGQSTMSHVAEDLFMEALLP